MVRPNAPLVIISGPGVSGSVAVVTHVEANVIANAANVYPAVL